MPTYVNAPCVEAIIEVQLAAPANGGEGLIAALAGIGQEIGYVAPRLVRTQRRTLSIKNNRQVETDESFNEGWMFQSPDGLYVVRVGYNTFAISRLKPYENWVTFHEEALRVWSAWRNVVANGIVQRIAHRMVNRLNFPDTLLENYITVGPGLPTDLVAAYKVNSFIVNVVFVDGSIEVRLTQSVVPPENDAIYSLMLDIGCEQADLQFTLADDDGIVWTTLNKLRDHRNRVFESSLTDTCKALFK